MAHVPVTTCLEHSIEPTPCLTDETYLAIASYIATCRSL